MWIFVLALTSLVASDQITAEKERLLLTSTVRVVDHAQVRGGVGTGAIVGANREGLFVLTAFHVIDPGTGIEVQWFDSEAQPTTCGDVKILAKAPEADLGLLFLQTTYRPPQFLAIHPSDTYTSVNETVISVGCSAGAIPSCNIEKLKGRISLKRPTSEKSFWLTSQPAIGGRSGGPLLDTAGKLIGVCRGGLAADENNPAEGLYSSLEEIHSLIHTAGVRGLLVDYAPAASSVASNTAE